MIRNDQATVKKMMEFFSEPRLPLESKLDNELSNRGKKYYTQGERSQAQGDHKRASIEYKIAHDALMLFIYEQNKLPKEQLDPTQLSSFSDVPATIDNCEIKLSMQPLPQHELETELGRMKTISDNFSYQQYIVRALLNYKNEFYKNAENDLQVAIWIMRYKEICLLQSMLVNFPKDILVTNIPSELVHAQQLLKQIQKRKLKKSKIKTEIEKFYDQDRKHIVRSEIPEHPMKESKRQPDKKSDQVLEAKAAAQTPEKPPEDPIVAIKTYLDSEKELKQYADDPTIEKLTQFMRERASLGFNEFDSNLFMIRALLIFQNKNADLNMVKSDLAIATRICSLQLGKADKGKVKALQDKLELYKKTSLQINQNKLDEIKAELEKVKNKHKQKFGTNSPFYIDQDKALKAKQAAERAEAEARKAAEQAATKVKAAQDKREARALKKQLVAEKARQEAEARAAAEAAAEEQARQEAEAKAIAKEQARLEVEVKAIAEQKAKLEAEAKAIVEEKARQEAKAAEEKAALAAKTTFKMRPGAKPFISEKDEIKVDVLVGHETNLPLKIHNELETVIAKLQTKGLIAEPVGGYIRDLCYAETKLIPDRTPYKTKDGNDCYDFDIEIREPYSIKDIESFLDEEFPGQPAKSFTKGNDKYCFTKTKGKEVYKFQLYLSQFSDRYESACHRDIPVNAIYWVKGNAVMPLKQTRDLFKSDRKNINIEPILILPKSVEPKTDLQQKTNLKHELKKSANLAIYNDPIKSLRYLICAKRDNFPLSPALMSVITELSALFQPDKLKYVYKKNLNFQIKKINSYIGVLLSPANMSNSNILDLKGFDLLVRSNILPTIFPNLFHPQSLPFNTFCRTLNHEISPTELYAHFIVFENLDAMKKAGNDDKKINDIVKKSFANTYYELAFDKEEGVCAASLKRVYENLCKNKPALLIEAQCAKPAEPLKPGHFFPPAQPTFFSSTAGSQQPYLVGHGIQKRPR